jgi:hypothetical protein
MAMASYHITRWTRLRWLLEDWAPYYYDGHGKRCWMTPWGYVALVWDRLVARRSWPVASRPLGPADAFYQRHPDLAAHRSAIESEMAAPGICYPETFLRVVNQRGNRAP